MNPEIKTYNNAQTDDDKKICNLLAKEIDKTLTDAENKIWHAHPVWFLDGNPIVGYSKMKAGIRLLFWSGASFEEEQLVNGKKFKDAGITYTAVKEVKKEDLQRWLEKSKKIQWDYKNIVKRKGELLPIEK